MPRFPNALQAWQSDAFTRTLKDEIQSMDARILPLQEKCAQGGLVDDAAITATVLESADDEHSILAEVGVFFTETFAACSCGDEPDSINNFCRLRIRIDKASAEAEISAILD